MIFLRNENLSGGSGNAELTEGLILDLDFNGNAIDKSPAGLVLTGGNSAGTNLPTFVPGRKAGTFCANFNGSQSLRTTSNLPLNSDKVTVSFWMKTVQTSAGVIIESSSNYNSNNAFSSFVNIGGQNKIDINDHTTDNLYNSGCSLLNINTGSWVYIILTIDRALGSAQNQIYINGQYSFSQNLSSNLEGKFGNYPLFIGQRGGASYGFNGQLQNFQVRNIALTDEQALQLYNSQL